MQNIDIKGAHVHNLQNIDISIPKNKLIVATGISGSGKSSLVFDIIFEEGRKQYLQSLGILTGFNDKEKFNSISGLSPTIAVKQNIIRQSNPRSTVGSRTNVINLLSLLYATEGQMCCSSCGALTDSNLICPDCGHIEERLLPTYFSYNSPNGMCMKCLGRGTTYEIDLDKLVPNSDTTLLDVFHRSGMSPGYLNIFNRKYEKYLSASFFDIPLEVRDEILYGHYVSNSSDRRSTCLTRIFQGQLQRGFDLGGIYRRTECPACHGYRICEEARRVKINNQHIGELGKKTITELHEFLEILYKQKSLSSFGQNLIKDLRNKSDMLIRSRLGHLSLYREIPSLSGGEIQRLFLHTHLDSKMDSLIYILDEPTVGLHETEKTELLHSLWELKENGNTVIVVEHDRSAIQMAEHIIDIGPKAGAEGGRIVFQGDFSGLLTCKDSLTGKFLTGAVTMPKRSLISLTEKSACLTICHANTNNLKDVTVKIPLGCMVGIAGVSGSGKSSLIIDTLVSLLKSCLQGETIIDDLIDDDVDIPRMFVEKIEGFEQLTGFAEISQFPIGRNSNSNPATYTGVWEKIRKLFAAQPEALKLGLTSGFFSFNANGACTTCSGSGSETIWLGGDLKIEKICPNCLGKRFNDQALSVYYKGRNIHEVLEMSITDALRFFSDNDGIKPTLKVMQRIGMGYIRLGQPTPSLSGGEAQRIKLAKEIGRRRKGNILYILDEPTTGLSLYDTACLIELLDELIINGNSVIVIEHSLEVLSVCDWIIELGPDGGAGGGEIIAQGTPYMLRNNKRSITGKYLS